MKILLLTNQSFLENELKKSKNYSNFYKINTLEEIYNLNISFNEKLIILQHLDSDEKNGISQLKENFENFYFIALRNNPNNIEGCSLLKKGYKSYIHSISNVDILDSVISSVKMGNTWIYPELMQFLIQSIPLNNNKQNKLLENLTIKEIEVIELVAEGLNNAQIAKTLNLAEVTIKKHISSLFKKLDVKDRLSLALIFKKN